MSTTAHAPIRIGNVSGFYGDRHAAMREMLDGGPVDVLTGDYLAELTMLILGRQRQEDPAAGYARTFLTQLEECLATALERGVRIVSNAGGLNPHGLAAAVTELGRRLGIAVRVATVSGDDLLPRLDDLRARRLLRAGDVAPGDREVGEALTANAYLGCWGIVRALEAGADVVVTGRVTDASLVVGPAAWRHGWTPDDLDALAGATVAGHVLECGAQATGGNFSFFAELLEADPGALDHVGFPLAEIAADGSCVITKHAGTGGAVTIETVTEQLLYELTGVRYGGPDVVTRFDELLLEQLGTDRVGITGARGLPGGGWLKVALNRLGGFRNAMTLPLTGLDIDRKAELLQRQLAPALVGVAEVTIALARTDHDDAEVAEEATALLHVTVKDPDRRRVGKAFTGPLIELGLASIPGFHATTAPASPSAYGVYAAAWVPSAAVPQQLVLPDGTIETLEAVVVSASPTTDADPADAATDDLVGPTRRVPLGRLFGARSGDKGGAATLGVYARSDEAYAWLTAFLTPDRLRALLPEAAGLTITRERLPGLRALLFQLPGLLGEGVAAGTRFDPQAKAVGEWLRARVVDVPTRLLPQEVPRVTVIGDRAAGNRAAMLERLAELEDQRALANLGGGDAALARHRSRGKLTVRERIELLLDRDSPFLELSPYAAWGTSFPVGASTVTGIGVVEGVEVMVSANDPTVRGGTSNPYTLRKAARAQEIAETNRLPFVSLVESGGADLPTQSEIFIPGGRGFRSLTRLSAAGIPTIALVFGNSTAGGAYVPGMSDHVVMIEGRSKVFLAGPPLVKMATGEDADDESLGGAAMHARTSGSADHLATDEVDAIRLGRQIVRTLNSRKRGPGPSMPADPPERDPEDLLSLAPADLRQPCDPRDVLACIVDGSRFDEHKPLYGTSLVTGWASIHGYPIGVLANARGVLFRQDAEKAAQFIQLANQTDTPLLFLQNTTGYMVGTDYEQDGIIKAGSQMINAVSNSTVPHITVNIGASYGAGNYGMCGRAYDPRFLFTWPNAKSAVMGAAQLAGVLDIVGRASAEARGRQYDEEAATAMRAAVEQQIEAESLALFLSGRVYDDGIIDPRDTRTVLGLALSVIHTAPVAGLHDGWGVFRL